MIHHRMDRKGCCLPAGLPVITKLKKHNPEKMPGIISRQYQQQSKQNQIRDHNATKADRKSIALLAAFFLLCMCTTENGQKYVDT